MPKPNPTLPDELSVPDALRRSKTEPNIELPSDLRSAFIRLLDTFPISFVPYTDTAKLALGDTSPWTLLGAASDVGGAGVAKLATFPVFAVLHLANKAKFLEAVEKLTADLIARGYKLPAIRHLFQHGTKEYILLRPDKASTNFADLPPEVREKLAAVAVQEPEVFQKTPIYIYEPGAETMEGTAQAVLTDAVVVQGKKIKEYPHVVAVDKRLATGEDVGEPLLNIGTGTSHEFDHIRYEKRFGREKMMQEMRDFEYEYRPHELRAYANALREYVRQQFLAGKISPDEAVRLQRILNKNMEMINRANSAERALLEQFLARSSAVNTVMSQQLRRLQFQDLADIEDYISEGLKQAKRIGGLP